MANFGGKCFANMGGGGGQNYFHYVPNVYVPFLRDGHLADPLSTP